MSHLQLASSNLVRLRADPTKIRVRIRGNEKDGWTVRLESLHVAYWSIDQADTRVGLYNAIWELLERAHQHGVPGINLTLERVYEHPQNISISNLEYYERKVADQVFFKHWLPGVLNADGDF